MVRIIRLITVDASRNEGRREVALFWDSVVSSFRLKNPNHHLDLQLVCVITAKLNVQHCGAKQYIAVTNC